MTRLTAKNVKLKDNTYWSAAIITFPSADISTVVNEVPTKSPFGTYSLPFHVYAIKDPARTLTNTFPSEDMKERPPAVDCV